MLKKYLIDVYKYKYLDISGRASVKEYWVFIILNLVLMLIAAVMGAILANISELLSYIMFPIFICLIIPSITILIRRLHDSNKSGWWILLCLIPIASLIVLYFTMVPSNPETNKYGECPAK